MTVSAVGRACRGDALGWQPKAVMHGMLAHTRAQAAHRAAYCWAQHHGRAAQHERGAGPQQAWQEVVQQERLHQGHANHCEQHNQLDCSRGEARKPMP